jgi:hypothetical protein
METETKTRKHVANRHVTDEDSRARCTGVAAPEYALSDVWHHGVPCPFHHPRIYANEAARHVRDMRPPRHLPTLADQLAWLGVRA